MASTPEQVRSIAMQIDRKGREDLATFLYRMVALATFSLSQKSVNLAGPSGDLVRRLREFRLAVDKVQAESVRRDEIEEDDARQVLAQGQRPRARDCKGFS